MMQIQNSDIKNKKCKADNRSSSIDVKFASEIMTIIYVLPYTCTWMFRKWLEKKLFLLNKINPTWVTVKGYSNPKQTG